MPVLEPISKQVTINSSTYRFNLLGARKQGKISSKLIAKAGALFAIVTTPQGLEVLSSGIDNFLTEETIDSIYELIFATEVQLSVLNGSNFEKIVDVDLHFQGKYMEMMQLAYKALEANCQDFFTFINGSMGSLSSSETFKKMQEQVLSKVNPSPSI